MNFGRNFGRDLGIFVKIYVAETFCCFYFFTSFISAQARLGNQSEQAPIQKLLLLSKRSGRLIGHFR